MGFTFYLPAQFKYTFHLWVAQMFHNLFTVTKPSCSQHCPINCICLILIRSKRCMPDISISLSSQMFSDQSFYCLFLVKILLHQNVLTKSSCSSIPFIAIPHSFFFSSFFPCIINCRKYSCDRIITHINLFS